MSLGWKVFVAFMVIVGAGVLFCMIAWWWTGRRGPSTGEREAVAKLHPLAQCCPHGIGMLDHCDACFPTRVVVAGSDLDPLENLFRAPAYGEEH